jgi:hypothetical protein
MKPAQFRQIREDLELDQLGMASLIGYSGIERNAAKRVEELERGRRDIPLYIGRLVWLEWRILCAQEGEHLADLLNVGGDIDWPPELT